MTQRLLDEFASTTNYGRRGQYDLLRFVVAGLEFGAASKGTRSIDVETVFSAIEALSNRGRMEVAPFIASWHPLVQAAERTAGAGGLYGGARRQLSRLLSDAIKETINDSLEGRSFTARDVERFVDAITSPDDSASPVFTGLSRGVLQALVQILELPDGGNLSYLEPLADLYKRQGWLTIASLNYDLVIEEFGRRVSIPVETGLESWPGGRLDFQSGIRLLKLHGSIDWVLAPPQYTEDLLPLRRVEKRAPLGNEDPALIFGAGNKLRADGPYLDLLRYFSEELDRAGALVTVGYSFRDAHVNSVIRSWMNASVDRVIAVVDPDAGQFAGMYSEERDTLGNELIRHCGWRTAIVPKPAAGGLAEALSATQQEHFVGIWEQQGRPRPNR